MFLVLIQSIEYLYPFCFTLHEINGRYTSPVFTVIILLSHVISS